MSITPWDLRRADIRAGLLIDVIPGPVAIWLEKNSHANKYFRLIHQLWSQNVSTPLSCCGLDIYFHSLLVESSILAGVDLLWLQRLKIRPQQVVLLNSTASRDLNLVWHSSCFIFVNNYCNCIWVGGGSWFSNLYCISLTVEAGCLPLQLASSQRIIWSGLICLKLVIWVPKVMRERLSWTSE